MTKPIQEYWDVRDRQGQKTGEVRAKGLPFEREEFHLAMEAWIINSKGQLLIQQRSVYCDLLPGMWGLTTGRVLSGEDSAEGCIRELKEELGLTVLPENIRFLTRILRGELIWDLYLVHCEAELSELKLQTEEVKQASWVSPEKFLEMLEEGLLFRYPEIEQILEEALKIHFQEGQDLG